MMTADNRWQNQYNQQKYSNSREERKNNLTKLGQMAVANNDPYYQQYANVQYQTQSNQQDIGSQLKLLKSKMNYRTPNYDIDQQTQQVNQQLSSLNGILRDKGNYRQQNYESSQNPFDAKNNRAPPIQSYQPSGQKDGYNTYSSYSTNNTNFGDPSRNRPYNPTHYLDQKQQPSDYSKPQAYTQNNYKQPINYQQQLTDIPNNNIINQQQYSNQYNSPFDQRKIQGPQNSLNSNHPINYHNNNQYNQYNQNNQQKEESYKPSVIVKNSQPVRQMKIPQQNSRNPVDEMPAVAKNSNKLKIDEQPNDDDIELIECPEGCGRQFNSESLDKHVKVCKKVFQSKRKEFNSKARRLVSQEQVKLQKQGQVKERMIQQKQKVQSGDPKWKKQSEQFRAMIQAQRQDKGSEGNFQYQDPYKDEYVECQGCGRRFNQKAAEKHIPSCISKQKIQRFKGRK